MPKEREHSETNDTDALPTQTLKASSLDLYQCINDCSLTVKVNPVFRQNLKLNLSMMSCANEVELFVTANQQFIIMMKTFIVFCMEIPIRDVCSIQFEADFHEDSIIALLSKTATAVVISIFHKSILGNWKDVDSIAFDDFLSIGHDQVVVTFREGESNTPEILVTDFSCCKYDSRKQSLSPHCAKLSMQSKIENKGQHSIVQALSQKFSGLLDTLSETRADIDDKKVLLSRSCSNLVRICQDQEKLAISNRLLVPVTESAISRTLEKECLNIRITIKSLWHRVFLNNLIVGGTLNSSKVENSIVLLLAYSNQECSSCIWAQNHEQGRSDSVLCKDVRHSETYSNFIFSSSVPSFEHSDLIQYTIYATWKTDDTSRTQTSYASSRLCQGTLSASDVSCGRFTVPLKCNERDYQSNLAFTYSMKNISVVVTSQYTDLNKLPNLLCTLFCCDCQYVADISIMNPSKLLGSEIRIQGTYNTCKIEVFSLSINDQTLILRQLRSVLPPDVKLDFVGEKGSQSRLDILEKEISKRIKVLTDENCGRHIDNTVETLTHSRKRKRDDEKSDDCSCNTDENSTLDYVVRTDTEILEYLHTNAGIMI